MEYLPFYGKDLYDKNPQGQRFLSLLISIMVVVGLYLISLVNYLLFHTLLEIICVVIVAGIFILTWNVRNYLTNNYLKIIGFCYGFIAVINLLHALTYGGINILSGHGPNQSIQFWMAEAYLLSITILIASFLIGDRRLNDYSVSGCLTIVTFTLLVAVFLGVFPDCFIKGKGLTPFKVFSEYAIIVVLIASLFPLYRKRAQFDRNVFALIFSSVFFTIISEIFFSGYTTLFDSANLVGHLLKVSAYCFIFQAILVTGLRKPFNIIFRDLKQTEVYLHRANETLEQKVIERTTKLALANRKLLDKITERKQAEKALRDNEEKYRTLIQKIQVAVVVHGSDKGILTCNSKAIEILGLTEEQLLGKTAVDPDWHFFREDNTIMPFEEYPVNLVFSSRNKIENYIVGVHRPNSNDDVWVLVNADPVWGKENELIQVIVTFVGITERKHAEEEIAWNLAINQALSSLYIPLVTTGISIEQIANIVLEKSRQLTGSPHGFVAEIDPVTGDLIAHTNTTVLQAECKIAEDEHRKIRFLRRADGLYNGLWGHSMNTGEPFYTDVPKNHPASVGIPEGHIAIERFLAVPVLPAGELVGLIALSNSNRAYTDRDLEAINRIADFYALAIQHKRTEEEIRQLNQELEQRVIERTAKLEAVNAELEAFAYSVSHDLRAPLRHIDGFMELLQKTIGTALDEQGRHYMDTISDSANKMGVLIDNLLSFSRMGRHAMSFQEVDLENLVRDVIRELEPDVAGRDIAWRIGDLPSVDGDASMLRMVLVNLIANALKFTRPRQQAQIEIGSLPGQDSETVVFVRDNGVGFDMTYVDKLFGVFQRLHRADEFEGTGIGLANVRRIIVRHGGRTWAEGKVDQGATFSFSLPLISQRK